MPMMECFMNSVRRKVWMMDVSGCQFIYLSLSRKPSETLHQPTSTPLLKSYNWVLVSKKGYKLGEQPLRKGVNQRQFIFRVLVMDINQKKVRIQSFGHGHKPKKYGSRVLFMDVNQKQSGSRVLVMNVNQKQSCSRVLVMDLKQKKYGSRVLVMSVNQKQSGSRVLVMDINQKKYGSRVLVMNVNQKQSGSRVLVMNVTKNSSRVLFLEATPQQSGSPPCHFPSLAGAAGKMPHKEE